VKFSQIKKSQKIFQQCLLVSQIKFFFFELAAHVNLHTLGLAILTEYLQLYHGPRDYRSIQKPQSLTKKIPTTLGRNATTIYYSSQILLTS